MNKENRKAEETNKKIDVQKELSPPFVHEEFGDEHTEKGSSKEEVNYYKRLFCE
jgi:hypothetical protein